jgi:prepilin-type processing-associated H-X9-DG protein
MSAGSGGSLSENNIREDFMVRGWWGNLIPTYLSQPGYRDLCEARLAAGLTVPAAGAGGSIFIDPAAEAPTLPGGTAFPYTTSGAALTDSTYATTGVVDTSVKRQFYFNYVVNSNLDNGNDDNETGVQNYEGKHRVNERQIPQPSLTILMLEIRSRYEELPEGDPWRNTATYYQARAHANWKRFAARHSGGGHLLFADGHAAHYSNEFVTTDSTGNRTSAGGSLTAGPTYNKPGVLIWDPFTPAPGNYLSFN